MHDRVEAFLHYLLAERGSSKNTIDAYRNDLRGFVRFLEARESNGSTPAEALSRAAVIDYIADLNNRSYARATVARKVAAVKSFIAFLIDHGDLATDPTAEIDSPRAPKPVPKPMTTEQVDILLREPLKNDSAEAVRDAAMLQLMYGTGMRVTELVSLNIDSLHLTQVDSWVRCLGKGGKERDIPLPDNAVEATNAYLHEARPILIKNRPQTALFVNRRGERLTRQGFWLILKSYAKSAGLDGDITPHTLRHSYATHMLRGGRSVVEVQERLGHANVSTTQIYTHLADGDLRDSYQDAHPRANVPEPEEQSPDDRSTRAAP